MDIWTYQHKTKFVFGRNSTHILPDELAKLAPSSVMIVCGRNAMRNSGILDRILALSGPDTVIFDRVPPNPSVDIIDEGTDFCKKNGCNTVIGLGGGSAIDAAKAISMMASHQGSIRAYLLQESEFRRPGLPVIAIPTTSGTGTEANPFFVIVVKDLFAKLSCAPEWAYPVVSILDPDLIVSLPPIQTASTGLDVMAHAFESLWAKPASPVTDVWAFEAISLTLRWLPAAVSNGADIDAREKMMLACLSAGLALCSTRTAVVHGVSYPLTVKWGLDHGFACAFTLPDFLSLAWDKLEPEKLSRLTTVLNTSGKKSSVRLISDFCLNLGTPSTLSEIGIAPSQISEIIDLANYKNIGNTKFGVDKASIASILENKISQKKPG